MPKFWKMPATLIKGMGCKELQPADKKEEQVNEPIEEGDASANQ